MWKIIKTFKDSLNCKFNFVHKLCLQLSESLYYRGHLLIYLIQISYAVWTLLLMWTCVLN